PGSSDPAVRRPCKYGQWPNRLLVYRRPSSFTPAARTDRPRSGAHAVPVSFTHARASYDARTHDLLLILRFAGRLCGGRSGGLVGHLRTVVGTGVDRFGSRRFSAFRFGVGGRVGLVGGRVDFGFVAGLCRGRLSGGSFDLRPRRGLDGFDRVGVETGQRQQRLVVGGEHLLGRFIAGRPERGHDLVVDVGQREHARLDRRTAEVNAGQLRLDFAALLFFALDVDL